ncbi:MAG: hypothetical protein WD768_11685 [Phycisphaeraceae bacterium]
MLKYAPVLLVCGFFLGGCNTPPPPAGNTGGRIDPYRTLPSEVGSGQASMTAMLELTDKTAQSLAREIADIPEFNDPKHMVVLAMGTLQNKTTGTSTGDFELIQARLRGQLFKSKYIRRDRILFVESLDRAKAEWDRNHPAPAAPPRRPPVDVGDDAPQPAPAQPVGPNVYDPNYTYVLQGDFYESVRAGKSVYYFVFKITNNQTRVTVFEENTLESQLRR